ncbi:hypothetical protein Tco_0749668 [Tanacetum coccineum]|uniref:Uncharacterized protein n=1 Tax=Tanacetum coccineum TaxID=301880 RepID=A0ABQ4Z270_9ASTR
MTNSNVVNAPREPFVVKQDPSVNSSQKSPLIDQKCCCECGDSLDGIFCQQCTSKHAQPEEVQELLSKLVQDVKIISDELSEYINTPAWNRPLVYCDDDDDEDYTIAITPVLSTEEPDNSLIMEDEHLDTISATESDEFIKSSVEILVPIPSESADSFSSNDVEYIEASLPILASLLEEKSSGSTTTHVDFSQYDSFIFDLSNDQFPPADRREPGAGQFHIGSGGKYFPNKRTKVHGLMFLPPLRSNIPCDGSSIRDPKQSASWEAPMLIIAYRSSSRSGYQQKDRKPSQNDKTEHGMEKTVQNQGQSPKMPKSKSILKNQQSNRSRN